MRGHDFKIREMNASRLCFAIMSQSSMNNARSGVDMDSAVSMSCNDGVDGEKDFENKRTG